MNYIRYHWHGEFSLYVSFWVNFILIGVLIMLGLNWCESCVLTLNNRFLCVAFLTLIWILNLSFAFWLSVGLWRSLKNHLVKYGKSFWKRPVQIIVIINFFSIIMSLWPSVIFISDTSETRLQNSQLTDYTLTLKKNNSILHLEGCLKRGLSKDVRKILKNTPGVKTIILDSTGGWASEGDMLSKLISNYNLDTYSLRYCNSACILAFISGENRQLAPGATLGFHRGKSSTGKITPDEEKNILFFKERGVDPEFCKNIFSAKYNEMWRPSVEELMDAGVVHGVVSSAELIMDIK